MSPTQSPEQIAAQANSYAIAKIFWDGTKRGSRIPTAELRRERHLG